MAESVPKHRVFLNRPLDLVNSLHCKVVVSSVRGIKVMGGLVAVDPVTDTAVIIDVDSDGSDINTHPVTVVPFVRWDTTEVIESTEVFKERVKGLLTSNKGEKHGMSEEDCKTARSNITAWLAKNGLESVLSGDDLIIAGAVVLEPPYTSGCCSATNEIILARVQSLLEKIQPV